MLAKTRKHIKSGHSNRSEIISSLDDCDFKVGRLSVEERKEKIHRYMKKRNERNFNKKIKVSIRTIFSQLIF